MPAASDEEAAPLVEALGREVAPLRDDRGPGRPSLEQPPSRSLDQLPADPPPAERLGDAQQADAGLARAGVEADRDVADRQRLALGDQDRAG